MRNVNLAHGSLYLFGGYFGFEIASWTGSWIFALRGDLHRRRAARHRAAVHHLPLDGGAGPAPDAGHHRALAHPRRPDAVALGRRLLPGADAGLARRAGRGAARHRDALERRARLPVLSAGAARDPRRRDRDRRPDVARAQPHQDRHADPRRRRRPRHAVGDRRARAADLPHGVRVRRRACGLHRRGRRHVPVAAAGRGHQDPARLAGGGDRRRHGLDPRRRGRRDPDRPRRPVRLGLHADLCGGAHLRHHGGRAGGAAAGPAAGR